MNEQHSKLEALSEKGMERRKNLEKYSQTPPEPTKTENIHHFDRGNPLFRCVAHKKTGERCRNWAIRGGTVCRYHGGATRHIKRRARENFERAADILSLRVIGIAIDEDVSPAVALAAAKDGLDRAGLGPKSEVTVEVKPWEQLMGDIAGIATIPRDEHRTRQPALVDPAEVIDAGLVPDALGGPENRPDSPGDAMRRPDREDEPDRDMPPGSDPPVNRLMTLEEAVSETTRTSVRRVTRRY